MNDWLSVGCQVGDFRGLREDLLEEGRLELDSIDRRLEKRKEIHTGVEVDYLFL